MTRLLAALVFAALAVGLWSAAADDSPKKLTAEERKELEAKWEKLYGTGTKAFGAREYAEAQTVWEQALAIARRLYPSSEFPDGHGRITASLNALAYVHEVQGRLAEAEVYAREGLEMNRRLLKGDRFEIVGYLIGLGKVLQRQGKLAEAEPLFREALETNRRLFKGDNRMVAVSMGALAELLVQQRKYDEAERLHRDALGMKKRLFGADHREVGASLNNLAGLLYSQGKLEEAESLFRECLELSQRVFKGDHPEVAGVMNNLALVLGDRGRYAQAEQLLRDSLEIDNRLFRGDHPAVAKGLHNLAWAVFAQRKFADAELLARDATRMQRRLTAAYARDKTEGETLTLVASLVGKLDVFLSAARNRHADPATIYPELWAEKGQVARVYEQRLQAARAAAIDPKAAKMLAGLAGARRRRAELILAPEVRDPAARARRETDIKNLDNAIAQFDAALRLLLPAIERAENLIAANPSTFQKALPPDVAVVDVLRYVYFEFEKDNPGVAGEKHTPSYLAFVLTRDRIAWVDLGPAEPIEAAVNLWQVAITAGKEIPPAIPAKVRELVWDKVRKELPASVKTVYISPDLALCRVPWAALPGDKPGTILLEDFAVATIPHGTFLLDQLWPQDAPKNPPSGVLVVGGVDYQTELAAAQPLNRNLPVKPDAKGWPALPGAAAETTGVAGAAAKKKHAITPLKGEKATAAAVLSELPKAKYAHFATHGFFADPSFRSVFQLDPKHFEMTRRGERVGAGALSPLVMTGLVFAGANHPKTPGRGILTGESLIDLDLSGLELAVLSACETGLGDVAGGEGTFGLQRAFHLAGTKNVVASLWKVPDQSTAALMALFYRNLWDKNLTPLESLRQAQLEIYRNPNQITALAEGFRGKFDEVPGAADAGIKPTADGKAHPRLWAAFTLSGTGR